MTSGSAYGGKCGLLQSTDKDHSTTTGLCGQAPIDYTEFAAFLVEEKIDSISFNPDALLQGIENINKAEKALKKKGDESDLIFYQ